MHAVRRLRPEPHPGKCFVQRDHLAVFRQRGATTILWQCHSLLCYSCSCLSSSLRLSSPCLCVSFRMLCHIPVRCRSHPAFTVAAGPKFSRPATYLAVCDLRRHDDLLLHRLLPFRHRGIRLWHSRQGYAHAIHHQRRLLHLDVPGPLLLPPAGIGIYHASVKWTEGPELWRLVPSEPFDIW